MKDKISLEEIKPELKSGNEKLTFKNNKINFCLLDFWQWSVSDILSNATRGKFAEFIVGTAINIDLKKVRDEWAPFDLKTEDGIKIEIKSASYIQSWYQPNYSQIKFSIKPARHWNSKNGKYSETRKRHSDLYVFCLLKHKNQKTINPLKLDQWEFYVISTKMINTTLKTRSSISLKALSQLTEKIDYETLNEKIQNVFRGIKK